MSGESKRFQRSTCIELQKVAAEYRRIDLTLMKQVITNQSKSQIDLLTVQESGWQNIFAGCCKLIEKN